MRRLAMALGLLCSSCASRYPVWDDKCFPTVLCLSGDLVQMAQIDLIRCENGWPKHSCAKQKATLQESIESLKSYQKQEYTTPDLWGHQSK